MDKTGQIGGGFYLYNYVNGSLETRNFLVLMNKDGTINYSVTQPEQFRSAINAHDIIVKEYSFTIPANASYGRPTVSVPGGYNFLCWVGAVSIGFVQTVYPANPTDHGTNFWVVGGQTTSNRNAKAWALYKN